MHEEFNPSRLDLARRRRGLAKAELARAIGVSARMITAYERHEYLPSVNTLERIASVLEFPLEFFAGPDLEEPPTKASSFRSMSRLSAREREQSLAAGALAMTLADWINERFDLPEPTVPDLQGATPETAARALRSEWRMGERPIRNMVHLLEAHGVRVFSLVQDCVSVDAFSFWRGELPYICLNTMKSAERSRMDAAHELGHLVLHSRGGPQGRGSELEAQQFGSSFLMPRDSVIAEAPRGANLDQLISAKRRWNVSIAHLVYRMHSVGLLTEWQNRALFVELSAKGYRTAEPNPAPMETSQVFDKVFRALREEGTTPAHIAAELNFPREELASLVFGLALTPLEGTAADARVSAQEPLQPELHLID